MAGDLQPPRCPYIEPGFLDAAECHRIRAAMDRGASEPAEILRHGVALDDRVRSAVHVEVDAETLSLVESRLESCRHRLAEWCSGALGAREGAGFVRYGPGGFYRPHRDGGIDPSWPGAARRQIALVVFLNGSREGAADGEFTGGALRLLDLQASGRILDIVPVCGSLVAFPAETLHEVAPIIGGARDVVVDWFY